MSHPNKYVCPISHELMKDPVQAADGFNYEHAMIAKWLTKNKKSPITNQKLANTKLVPNHTLKSAINVYLHQIEARMSSNDVIVVEEDDEVWEIQGDDGDDDDFTDKYVGEEVNGVKHGRGAFRWRNGDTYYGNWRNDRISGHGMYTYANRDNYDGFFLSGEKNGEGSFVWANGDTYAGNWADDQMNGHGVFKYKNGDCYEGEFLNGVKHGRGSYTSTSGNKYVGEWHGDDMSGNGVFIFANGDRYEGQFLLGKKNGHGTYSAKNGYKYVGEWANDQKTGSGVVFYSNSDDTEIRMEANSKPLDSTECVNAYHICKASVSQFFC